MPERVPPFTKDQIGTGAVRFPSGVPIPTTSDAMTDPYIKTRVPKEVQVEGIMFWPQEKGTFPGLVLLHDAWGLNAQVQDVAVRLAREGYVTLAPNLYSRQGGMVTANAEVAAALAARVQDTDILQDLNSCCEFLNMRDHVTRNVHGVIAFGMSGGVALKFAGQRKRLKAAVAFYGPLADPAGLVKPFICPVLYHRAGTDHVVTDEQIDQLQRAAKEHGKRVDVQTYEGAPAAFFNETRANTYRPDAARLAWETTVQFLEGCFKDAKASG
jgi:carboxymethylenebutenolidase